MDLERFPDGTSVPEQKTELVNWLIKEKELEPKLAQLVAETSVYLTNYALSENLFSKKLDPSELAMFASNVVAVFIETSRELTKATGQQRSCAGKNSEGLCSLGTLADQKSFEAVQ